MDKREKLNLALNHKSGPVPFDIGATAVTGIHITMVEKLRDYYGLEKRPVKLADPLQLLGCVDEDLMKAIGVDVTGISNPNTMFGFKDIGEKEWRTPWGQEILVPEKFITSHDSEGNIFIYVDGDTTIPPSGVLPVGGDFFNCLTRNSDYDEDDSNYEDNLEEFGEISDVDLKLIAERAKKASKSGYAVIGSFGGTAFGDVAFIPGSMLKYPKGLRDVSEWYMATIADQEYIHNIFEAQCKIAIKNLEKIKATVGDIPQAAFICGTDFGTQNGPFCSVDTFRELYKPYYKIVNDWIHKNTSWKTFKHSCGSILPIIPELIDCGFDILNPVQWTAKDMDAKTLKNEFGKDVVFWGAGVNTQKTFPFKTPEEVRREVLEMCEIFSQDGGFVFNTIHNIQAKTPLENLVALIDAVKEFNGNK